MSTNKNFDWDLYSNNLNTIGNITVETGQSPIYSIYDIGMNGTSATDYWSSQNLNISIRDDYNSSGTLVLKGENADININGESLKETLQSIKDALRIPGKIQQDAKLEESFEELRELREKYERLCKEYREKQQVWDILNKE